MSQYLKEFSLLVMLSLLQNGCHYVLETCQESGKRYHLNPHTCSCVGFIEIVNRMVFHSIFLIKAILDLEHFMTLLSLSSVPEYSSVMLTLSSIQQRSTCMTRRTLACILVGTQSKRKNALSQILAYAACFNTVEILQIVEIVRVTTYLMFMVVFINKSSLQTKLMLC